MNFLATIAIGIVAFLGGLIPGHFSHQTYDAGGKAKTVLFGSTGYPAAIDTTSTLPNPNPTDSVATVSHSALHTNENDSIKAVEAKLGIGASTATNNTVLIGNGVGSSAWSASPTLTGLTLTNLLLMGSSTFQNLTFVNATGTNATTTNFFATNLWATNASSTNLTSNSLTSNSATISSLTVSSCSGCGSTSSFSTTSVQQLATTTIPTANFPATNNFRIKLFSPKIVGVGTASSTAKIFMTFNDSSDPTKSDYGTIYPNSAPNTEHNYIVAAGAGLANGNDQLRAINVEMNNTAVNQKFGSLNSLSYGTTTGAFDINTSINAANIFFATTTSKITSVSFWFDTANAYFGTSTYIEVTGY